MVKMPKVPKVIMFANQKGGVGKTTSTFEVGFILSKRKYSVLLIDLDSQCNLSEIVGKDNFDGTIFDTIMGVKSFKDSIIEIRPNLDLLPGSRKMLSQYFTGSDDVFVLREALEFINDYKEYDFILIDVGPEGGQLMTMAMLASDYVIAVSTLAKLPYSGVVQMCADIKRGRARYNSFDVKPLGILINTSKKNNVSNYRIEKYEELAKDFGADLFHQQIKNAIAMDECKEFGMALSEYKPGHIISIQYNKVVDEILKRIKQ